MKEQILEQIENFERKSFYLEMKDHWTSDDYSMKSYYNGKIRELEAELKKLEENG